MARFTLIATLGAVSLGLVACGDYDRAEYEGNNAAYGAGESKEGEGGYAAPAGGNTTIVEGSRIVIDPSGTRVRVDPDGTRVRIGPNGAEIDVPDVDIDARVRTGEDPRIEINTNRR